MVMEVEKDIWSKVGKITKKKKMLPKHFFVAAISKHRAMLQ